MQKKCLENISENDYKEFLQVLERLVSLPFSYRLAPESITSRLLINTDLQSPRRHLPMASERRGHCSSERLPTATV